MVIIIPIILKVWGLELIIPSFRYDEYYQVKTNREHCKSNATITGAQVGKFTQEKGTDNKLITSVDKKTGWGGWYYPFKKTYLKASANPAVIKGLTPLIAMQNRLICHHV
jgi:type IV pilus assembly protein PilY1